MSFSTIGGGDIDPLLWAKRPRSTHALEHLLQCVKEGHSSLANILSKLISDGVCTAEGKLLKRWDCGQWVAV